MKSKGTTHIRVETYEVTTVRRRTSRRRAWCMGCDAEVEMMTPNRAAEWAAVPSKTISAWLEAGKLHATEVAPRPLYICLNSLKRQMRELHITNHVRANAPWAENLKL